MMALAVRFVMVIVEGNLPLSLACRRQKCNHRIKIRSFPRRWKIPYQSLSVVERTDLDPLQLLSELFDLLRRKMRK